MVSGIEKGTYWLVFGSGDVGRLKRFLHKDFNHCYAIKDNGLDWIRIQPYKGVLGIKTYPKSVFTTPQTLVHKGENMYKVEVMADLDRVRGGLCYFSCVEVCKALIGMKKPFIFTPYQLMKAIR